MSKRDRPPAGYEVGYGRPPVHSRFRKGQSGNPSGKPRNVTEMERAKTLVRKECYRLITVREGDRVKRMPTLQAILRSHLTLAAKGNITAQRLALRTIQEIEAAVFGPPKASNAPSVESLTDEQLMAICRSEKSGRS